MLILEYKQKSLPHYSSYSKEYKKLDGRCRQNRKKYGIKAKTSSKMGEYHICNNCKILKHNSKFIVYFNNHYKQLRISSKCKECSNKLLRTIYRDGQKLRRTKLKIRAFKIIQPELKCVRCGCDDMRLLEVNHRNGGGSKEYGRGASFGTGLWQRIVSGIRKTDDLELLCRPCNHIHYLELKYGKLPMKIVWKPEIQAQFEI